MSYAWIVTGSILVRVYAHNRSSQTTVYWCQLGFCPSHASDCRFSFLVSYSYSHVSRVARAVQMFGPDPTRPQEIVTQPEPTHSFPRLPDPTRPDPRTTHDEKSRKPFKVVLSNKTAMFAWWRKILKKQARHRHFYYTHIHFDSTSSLSAPRLAKKLFHASDFTGGMFLQHERVTSFIWSKLDISGIHNITLGLLGAYVTKSVMWPSTIKLLFMIRPWSWGSKKVSLKLLCLPPAIIPLLNVIACRYA